MGWGPGPFPLRIWPARTPTPIAQELWGPTPGAPNLPARLPHSPAEAHVFFCL